MWSLSQCIVSVDTLRDLVERDALDRSTNLEALVATPSRVPGGVLSRPPSLEDMSFQVPLKLEPALAFPRYLVQCQ